MMGVVVGVVTEQPGASSGVVDQTLAMLDGLADEGGRGSLESLGRWNEKRDDRAMPIKLEAEDPSRDKCKAERNRETMVRVALGRLVDELVRTNASSGILAISYFSEIRGTDNNRRRVTVWGFSWSASPDDTSYQRHGSVAGTASTKYGRYGVHGRRGGGDQTMHENIRFADFEGVIDDIVQDKAWDKMAVYRVTLPSRGLDPWKWAGRPPPPAPEELYTGPRSDGLLSTDEISGEYSAPDCSDMQICNSMTVVPLGADVIETWRTGCCFLPPLMIAPIAQGWVWTRKPGTNAFLNEQNSDLITTFSADGTAKQGCGSYKKTPGLAETDLPKGRCEGPRGRLARLLLHSGHLLLYLFAFAHFMHYEEGAQRGPVRGVGTLFYSVFAVPRGNHHAHAEIRERPPDECVRRLRLAGSTNWHRDPGCAAAEIYFAKKVG